MSPVSASVLGSRRPSIDGMSSTCTSQSEVRSFKDRLREHVNQVKVILTEYLILYACYINYIEFQERASNTAVVEQTKTKIQPNVKQPAERLAQLVRLGYFIRTRLCCLYECISIEIDSLVLIL